VHNCQPAKAFGDSSDSGSIVPFTNEENTSSYLHHHRIAPIDPDDIMGGRSRKIHVFAVEPRTEANSEKKLKVDERAQKRDKGEEPTGMYQERRPETPPGTRSAFEMLGPIDLGRGKARAQLRRSPTNQRELTLRRV